MALAIGIDLGTTYSCMSIYRASEDRIDIIYNQEGDRTTPSYVAFADGGQLVGRPAMSQASRNPTGTIFDAKRIIGHGFKDAEVQADIKRFPFKVTDLDNLPVIEVECKGKTKVFRAEQISGIILKKMRDAAETSLGTKVTDAVITVPAYFNDAQRKATKDAGALAGLNVLRIINEPTAAAIAYGFDKKPESQILLVFDLGGGTFDVTLLEVNHGKFEVRSTGGNAHLGGQDFVARLVTYVTNDFKQRHKKDLTARALSKLQSNCEQAKILLSSSTTADIDIDCHDIEYSITISRATFEQLCDDIFRDTIDTVKRVIANVKGMKKAMINEVILVGGSTRIPKIRQLLTEYFEGKKLNESLNPEEGVAQGAAIMAANLSDGTRSTYLNEMLLFDVAPMSLGISAQDETNEGLMDVLIPRNTTVPAQKARTYTTAKDFQAEIEIEVYEGEHDYVEKNHLLGVFYIDVAPAKAGVPNIDISFNLDLDGLLHVSATDRQTDKSAEITIKSNTSRLSEQQIEQIIADAENDKVEDRKGDDQTEADDDQPAKKKIKGTW